MNFLRSALCVVVLLVAAPLLLCAQQTGVLSATVHDATGAVIQGAKIVVIGNGIQSQTAETNELGVSTFSKLSPGSYTMVVSAPGFKESRTEYVNVTAGETTPLEVTLEPGGSGNRGDRCRPAEPPRLRPKPRSNREPSPRRKWSPSD